MLAARALLHRMRELQPGTNALRIRLCLHRSLERSYRVGRAPSVEGRQRLLEERLQIIGEDTERHTQGGLGLL